MFVVQRRAAQKDQNSILIHERMITVKFHKSDNFANSCRRHFG